MNMNIVYIFLLNYLYLIKIEHCYVRNKNSISYYIIIYLINTYCSIFNIILVYFYYCLSTS